MYYRKLVWIKYEDRNTGSTGNKKICIRPYRKHAYFDFASSLPMVTYERKTSILKSTISYETVMEFFCVENIHKMPKWSKKAKRRVCNCGIRWATQI